MESGLEPSDAEDSTEPSTSGAAAQSEADMEMAAMLVQVAKSIQHEWILPSSHLSTSGLMIGSWGKHNAQPWPRDEDGTAAHIT